MIKIEKTNDELQLELQKLKLEHESLKIAYQNDIIELKKTEEFIRNSGEKYWEIVNNVSDVIWTMGFDGRFTYISPSVENMLGFTPSEFMQQTMEDVLTAESFILASQIVEKVFINIQSGKPVDNIREEIELRSKNGSEVWTEVNVSVCYNSNRDFVEFIGISRDITERKKSDEITAESKEIFKTIFENNSAALLIVEPDSSILLSNEELYNISGYTSNEVFGKSWTQFVHPEDIERMKEYNLKRVVNPKDAPSKYECRMYHKDGKLIDIFLSISILNNRNLIVSIVDITERKKAENEILKLSKGVEQSPASIIITDNRGIIEYVNPKFCKISGYSRDEVIGENPRILKSGNIPKEYIKELWDTILSGNEWHGELLNKRKNGEFYWESAYISPVKNNKGDITHFIAVKEDITEQKKTAEELKELYENIKVSNEMIEASLYQKNILLDELTESEEKLKETIAIKDKFFSIIAHDLKGPFSGFLGLTDLMAKEIEALSAEELKKMSEAINKSANSVYKLIEDLLLWSRAQIGSIPFLPEKLDLYELSFNATFSLKQMAANKKIELIQTIMQGTEITFDRNMIATVFRNLLSNGIKFTNEGGIVQIGIENSPDYDQSSEICIYVKDTGIGITESNMSKLFKIESHYSTSGTNQESGTGLGLILNKEFIEKHGGRIWVKSEEGKGSTFYFTLPKEEKIIV